MWTSVFCQKQTSKNEKENERTIQGKPQESGMMRCAAMRCKEGRQDPRALCLGEI